MQAPVPNPLATEIAQKLPVATNSERMSMVRCSAAAQRFEQSTDAAIFRARMPGSLSAADVLVAWGYLYFGDRSYCFVLGAEGRANRYPDWGFLFTEWQRSSGTKVTGAFTSEDVGRLRNAVEMSEQPRAEVAQSQIAGSPPPWSLSSSKQDRTVFGRVELGEPLAGAAIAGRWEKYPQTAGLEIKFVSLPQSPEWIIPMRTTVGEAHLAVVTQDSRAIQVKFIGFAKDCALASKLFEERFGRPSFASGSGDAADWTKGDVSASIHCNLLSGAPADIPFVFAHPVPRGQTWYFATYTITLTPALRLLDQAAAADRQQKQDRIERSGPKL